MKNHRLYAAVLVAVVCTISLSSASGLYDRAETTDSIGNDLQSTNAFRINGGGGTDSEPWPKNATRACRPGGQGGDSGDPWPTDRSCRDSQETLRSDPERLVFRLLGGGGGAGDVEPWPTFAWLFRAAIFQADLVRAAF